MSFPNIVRTQSRIMVLKRLRVPFIAQIVFKSTLAPPIIENMKMVESILFKTLPELQSQACKAYKDRHCLGTRVGAGFNWISYSEFGDMVHCFRKVLKRFDISRGDNSVKMYPDNIGLVKSVICFDEIEERDLSYRYLMSAVDGDPSVPVDPTLSPDDLATIMYTSGTTGRPKGVELSHNNIVSNILALRELKKDELESNISLAFLPWSHLYGLAVELNALLSTGSTLAITTREQILENIKLVRPTLIVSVPMLFNRVYDGVHKAIAEASALKRVLFDLSISIARERNELLENHKSVGAWLEFKHKMADKIVLSKIRDKMGGRVRYMGAGGAATSLPVLRFFEDIGIPILEGYGLTESSPIICASTTSWINRKIGTCGVPLSGVIVKILNPETLEDVISGDGEICVAGPNVMVGYHNNARANAEVFFIKDGMRFLRTGDIGRWHDDKFLRVTGRLKEQFKLLNGKYVVPIPLEDTLCRSPYITQALLYGDNRPFTVALIVPNAAEIRLWAEKHQIHGAKSIDLVTLMQNEGVHSIVTSEIMKQTSTFKSYERPVRWAVVVEAFSQENHLMTPKLSLRRNHIVQAYISLIEGLYTGKDGFSVFSAPKDEGKTSS